MATRSLKDEVALYIDGVRWQLARDLSRRTQTSRLEPDGQLGFLGSLSPAALRPLDDISLYDRALTAEEIAGMSQWT
jgi:hypothetical protein